MTCGRKTLTGYAIAGSIITLSLLLLTIDIARAEVTHPANITVNGKSYKWPAQPLVVVLIDGSDPEYVNAAFERGLLPTMNKFMEEGFAAEALGAMPSFTNPNNISVITGVPPAKNGISGNYFLNPKTGEEVMMNEPEFIRADSILAKFSQAGAKVVALTSKDKLSRMLAHGINLDNGISFSSEKADRCTRKKNGIENCLELVGRPLPNEYSGELSLFMLEAGVRIFEREKPDLMYLSTSDYIQHTYAPGSQEANEFYIALDDALGRLVAAGATVAVTADHGMNDKSRADGTPNVIFLQDVLDAALGEGKTRVILPITDPYVKHHGALGSFATVFFNAKLAPADVMKIIDRQPGVELVMERKAAAREFELPADRIGDLIVIGDKGTALGTKKENHDLSKLAGHRLRSHGGLADRNTYLMFSRPLNDKYARIAGSRRLRNFDVFDFALNGLKSR
jgi:phosphonoacetate hydrolase